ncbi:dTDP-4-dehydrorhamnose reductase [Aldersonia kunmingensis]|uniref:dTDP-4-dehydrorhamnose reductase n=1 Tax=Aldersonia kunmingensis TaxID=408066 RepID=UPI000832147A|nr:dTDP-4-dehydrorhamnose reductase [Aldersonia kunmingensis]
MRVTVVGAAGQLGRALSRRAQGVQLRAFGSADLDITDSAAAEALLDADDVVINCAAYTAVDQAETDEERAYAVNADGARALAAACARTGARLIHVSTDYVFAGNAEKPYDIDAPTAPATAYGRTKLAGELAVHEELPSAHVVRTAWVYTGEGGDFVATMRRLERERETLDVVNDQVGSPTFADDLADGLLELAQHPEAPPLLHLTNGGVASWFDLAQATFELIGADPARVRPCTSAQFIRPAPRPAYSVLSDRAWVDAGLTPLRDWRAGLSAALHE